MSLGGGVRPNLRVSALTILAQVCWDECDSMSLNVLVSEGVSPLV